jgi:hypothetical protein
MKNITKPVTALAVLGLALTACSSSGVKLTPQPPPGATTYRQIELLSRPAIKEVFEPFQDHQITNAVEPYNDPTLKSAIQTTEDALRPPKGAIDYGAALASVLYPDEYLVNLAGSSMPPAVDGQFFLSAEVAPGSFGGRAPNDDVVDLELGALFGKTLSALGIIADDGEENNCLSSQNTPSEDPAKKTTSTFPYLAAAR